MAASPDEIRHLLSRTGFGVPKPDERDAFTGLDHGIAVERLLDAVGPKAATTDPTFVVVPGAAVQRGLTRDERQVLQRQRAMDGNNMKAWWWSEMLETPSPLTEHMVLFWHNHFTSSLRKVKVPPLLFTQNTLFRTHATGNFATLLRAAAKDPAMLVYLDNNLNRAGAPNENFARELLELFTLGEGNGYTERDIQEAARAFTGWRFRPDGGFVNDPRSHDGGTKTFLGVTGALNGNDILDVVLQQPRVAEHITEKLWREFISDTPDAAEVRRLAAIFRDGRYEVRPLLEAMLNSDAFRARDAHGTMVKSPVDLVVGTFRLIGATPREPRLLTALGRNLGQDLFDPPNVKGWPGGEEWVDTANLPARHAFLFSATESLALLENAAQQGGNAARTRQQLRAQDAAGQVPPAQLPPAARLRLQQQLQQQGTAPETMAEGMTPPPAPLPGGPQAQLRAQINLRNLDVAEYRTLRAMDEDELAALVLPMAPVAPGDATTTLGRLFLDPTYQLK
ncbi:MAG: DUF1800 domain-containing protein [Alphaproteobacteria bacterium]|nr:DUF1800 domain-containing protein [Alphaproteobacteria bacterium]